MAGIWYRAGTVAVTSGSTKVVGTGTTWKSGVYKPDKGHIFWGPDGRAYEVDYVESDTVLYLVTAYVGGSATGQAYSIVISITGQVPAFSRELSAFVAYHQSQMDGWQQLLTGTGDVTLTAPDGTKITTPSWDKVMNAGYGVVAQAAAQAAIATSEAKKASASASAAAGAVEAAALPLPRLWAPLTNNLQLFTGYGRDVVVGDDVVATVATFTRSTSATCEGKDGVIRPLGINQPAFTSAGLLLEGVSTNIIPSYVLPTEAFGYNAVGVIAAPIPDTNATVLEWGGTVPSAFVRFGSALAAAPVGTKTSSCFVMAIGTPLTIVIECEDQYAEEYSIPADEWVRVSATRQIASGTYSNFFDVQIKNPSVGQRFAVCAGQLEPLPFASSPIQTQGAAATRAATRFSIASINMSKRMTLALELAANRPVSEIHGSSIIREPVFDEHNRRTLSLNSAGHIQLFEGQGVITCPYQFGKKSTVVARFDGENSALFVNGIKGDVVRPCSVSSVNWGDRVHVGGSGGVYPDDLFGTISSFRIYDDALSDDQMRAIK